LERVVEASLRATALCAEMIASAGPGAVEVRRLHLTDVVHRALRLLQPSTSTRVRVEGRFERELPWVLADEAQLKRVFENLFLNACEAVEAKGGVVRVTTGAARFEARDFDAMVFAPRLPAGEYVWFEVEDDGVGMDALTQSRMFDPFFSTKFAGRGLGLSSSASIVRSHNGAIEVASQPGRGTRMRVLLPKAL
jgi:signal transduction histidine kinase